MGFSAEQLARWVAERTDVNVCGLVLCSSHFRRDTLWMFFIIKGVPSSARLFKVMLMMATAKGVFLLMET